MKYNFDCNCDGCKDEYRNLQMSGYFCECCGDCVGLRAICARFFDLIYFNFLNITKSLFFYFNL